MVGGETACMILLLNVIDESGYFGGRLVKQIGIIEDDEVLCRELQYFLSVNGYDADIIPVLSYDAKMIAEKEYQLLLLDIKLPEVDGLYLCREIRKLSDIPIIMITSQNTEMTELMSMNYGADDFVAKPFNTQILLARIEAIMKRVYKKMDGDMIISFEEFELNIAKGKISSIQGSEELTKNELKILTVLGKRKGEIISRDEIISELWDDKMFVDDNTLTVNMTRLRGKLEKIGVKDAIKTKRGMGYYL